MKDKIIIIAVVVITTIVIFAGSYYYISKPNLLTLGAPVANIMRSLVPEIDNRYYLGTTSPKRYWANTFTNVLTITNGTATTTINAGDSVGGGAAFAWTPTPNGNATSTTLIFNNGFISNASSTAQNLSVKNLFATSTIVADGLTSLLGGLYDTGSTTFAGSATTTFSQQVVFGDGVQFKKIFYGDTSDTHIELSSINGTHIGYGSGANHTNFVLTAGVFQFTYAPVGEIARFDSTGLIFGTDNTLNIGAVLATRPKNIFLGGGAFASSTASYFGGLTIDPTGQLVIPQGTAPTVDAAGEIGEDTNTNGGVTQLIYGAAGNVLTPLIPFAPSTGTSTLTNHGAYGTAGTTTLQREGFPQAVVVNSMSCRTKPISGNGTTTVVIGKGSASSPNNSQYIVADDRPTSTPVTLTSNNTFMAGEKINISWGNRISNADYITCSGNVTPLRQ